MGEQSTIRETETSKSRALEPLPKLVSLITQAAGEAKAFDVTILDLSSLFSLSDHFVILSGRSDRHVQGICNRIRAHLRDEGVKPLAIEGYDKAHWILMDFDDVLVHVFYGPEREKYSLESLWVGAKELPIPDGDEQQAA